VVISTPDAARGAPPLVRSNYSILKVNGDYRDDRIFNTTAELTTYPAPLRRLLDQVFNEYGLIVVGWSAEWDIALCGALERASARRYSTFWTTRAAEPKSSADRLIAIRGAELVHIASADDLLVSLSDKVSALETLGAEHPLTSQVAVATVKRYLVDPTMRIRLHDLILETTNRAVDQLAPTELPPLGMTIEGDKLDARLKAYLSAIGTLGDVTITACYWASEDQLDPFLAAIKRVGNYDPSNSGLIPASGEIRLFPGVALLYMAGIASVARSAYGVLRRCLLDVALRGRTSDEHPVPADVLFVGKAIAHEVGQRLPGMEGHFVPGSDYLHAELRSKFVQLIPDDDEYSAAFDRYELLHAMSHCDRQLQAGRDAWAPIGRFRHRRQAVERAATELNDEGTQWLPLQGGLFGGSAERATSSLAVVREILRHLPWF
jgi:hypothetical protein